MAQAASISQYVGIGMGTRFSMFGEWYDNEMAKKSYEMKKSLTWREKQQARQQIEMNVLGAGMVKGQAEDAKREAADMKRVGDIASKNYQEATDAGASQTLTSIAAQGVDVSFGSPMEYMDYQIEKRAEGLGLLKWQTERQVYSKEVEAKALSDKATIMLHEADIAYANLPLYDYQMKLYDYAKEQGDIATMISLARLQASAFQQVGQTMGGSGGGMSGGGGQ